MTFKFSRGTGGLALVASIVLSLGVVVSIVRSTGGDDRKPSRTSSSISTASWVRVVDHVVGFRDRLPAQPADHRLPAIRIGPVVMRVRVATIGRSVVIERLALPAELNAGDTAAAFREAIASFGAASGFDKLSETATSFQNQLAREGTYRTDTGTIYKALVFVDGAGSLYMIATVDRYFDAVKSGFHPDVTWAWTLTGPSRRHRSQQLVGASA